MLTNDINVFWLIVASAIVVLLLAFAIIFFLWLHQQKEIKQELELQRLNIEKQNQLIEAAIQSEEAERSRIAAELHDEVGALLSTIKLYLTRIEPASVADKSKVLILESSKRLLDESIDTVRNISSNLQPTIIRSFGLVSTLQNFCNKLNQTSIIHAKLVVPNELGRFNSEKELAVYRIIQEVTNNIIKHSGAKNINISLLTKGEEGFDVSIEHDGNGLDQDRFQQSLYNIKGLGLKNIQNRLTLLKTSIRFAKYPNAYDSVIFHVPLNAQP